MATLLYGDMFFVFIFLLLTNINFIFKLYKIQLDKTSLNWLQFADLKSQKTWIKH